MPQAWFLRVCETVCGTHRQRWKDRDIQIEIYKVIEGERQRLFDLESETEAKAGRATFVRTQRELHSGRVFLDVKGGESDPCQHRRVGFQW